jgi:hypothetical protein
MTFRDSWYREVLMAQCLDFYGQNPQGCFPYARTLTSSDLTPGDVSAFNLDNKKQLIFANVIVSGGRSLLPPGPIQVGSDIFFQVRDINAVLLGDSAFVSTNVMYLQDTAVGSVVYDSCFIGNLDGVWFNYIQDSPSGGDTFITITGYRFTF